VAVVRQALDIAHLPNRLQFGEMTEIRRVIEVGCGAESFEHLARIADEAASNLYVLFDSRGRSQCGFGGRLLAVSAQVAGNTTSKSMPTAMRRVGFLNRC